MKSRGIEMLSYIFNNKKKSKEDIIKLCNEEFTLQKLENNINSIFLYNDMLTILIRNEHTHVILNNEETNIKKIEEYFNGEKRWI